MDIASVLDFLRAVLPNIPIITTVFRNLTGGFKDLMDAGSPVAKMAIQKYTDTAANLQGPKEEQIDTDRIDAIAQLNRSVVPFALIEYLYFVSKIIFLAAMYRYMAQALTKSRRNKS